MKEKAESSALRPRLEALMAHYGLSQGKFALQIGSYGSQVSQIMSGSNPGFDFLLRILNAFPEVHADWLMRGEGPMLRNAADAGSAYPVHAAAMVPTDEADEEGAPVFVSIPAQAGYLQGVGDPEYVERLPTVKVPFFKSADIRIFEVKGDSMEPTFYSRDIVFAQRIYSLDEIRNGRVYVVVSRADGIVLKRVVRNRGENHITLFSDNKYYKPYPLADEDILELWYFRRKFTAQVPPPSTLEDRVYELEKSLFELEKKVKKQKH